ncbi:14843_t:CDS:2, partial [Funneliformis mosseae]
PFNFTSDVDNSITARYGQTAKEYVLLEDYDNTYQVKFMWNQTTLSENNREFTLGRMTYNFIANSEKFQENNKEQIPILTNNQNMPEKLIRGKFRYILPCLPF